MAQAIIAALGRDDPPFLPPPDYCPDLDDVTRRRNWRSGKKYPGLDAPFDALLHMSERAVKARRALQGGQGGTAP